jgi:hypothetical protein
MANALQLGLHIAGGHNIAVGKMPKIKLYAGLKAPVSANDNASGYTLICDQSGVKIPKQ